MLAVDTANTSVTMAFKFGLGLLLSVWLCTNCHPIHMDCHERFLRISVDPAVAGNDPLFEAVDGASVYPITTQYAAVCGYTINVCPLSGFVFLKASYFSCHTENQVDEVFTFYFNLKVNPDGKEVTYSLNKTCSPSVPWSAREVTCMMNYMEVSVSSDLVCPTGTRKDDWNAVIQTAYTSATSDWQVMFHRGKEHLQPTRLSEAHTQGYMFDLTERRLVFRTPYGQPDSYSTQMSGVPVEVVHTTLFSRQSWVVIMVDLVAACSMDEGSFNNGYITWETPEVLHPLVSGNYNTQVSVGVNGELVEQLVAEERGYVVEKHNATVMISIPYKADGGQRKSSVMGDLYEYYIFPLYVEQISEDEDHMYTRLRFDNMLVTPLLPRPVFTENRTVLEDRVFTVYLGDVPEDVKLTAVQLNGCIYTVPFINSSGHTITEVVHDNHTHDYTVQVPFDHHVVTEQFSREDEAMKVMIDINFTLTVLPENEHFYQHTSVYTLKKPSPPEFEANCSETGIIFKMDHRPFDYLWFISIGSERLTPELAAEHKYNMRNDSQSLVLEVPLFTDGYQYKDFSLKGFLGTFEILVRDHEMSNVQGSTVKTCPFTAPEIIACSTDGMMAAIVDLSQSVANGGIPARTNLVDKYCGPKEADDTRMLFSFSLNSCGSIAKLGKDYVTYENEIFINELHAPRNLFGSTYTGIKLQCTYPLAGLHRLFSKYKFESDTEGVGRIVRDGAHSTEVVQKPMEITAVLQTPVPATSRHTKPVLKPAHRPPIGYLMVPSLLKNLSKKGWCLNFFCFFYPNQMSTARCKF
uniref:Zona pellucida protein AX 4 n=1 Tax=Cynoglossus semilaevis TaxID=244447 RepID=A0A3P8UE26_CYNSE